MHAISTFDSNRKVNPDDYRIIACIRYYLKPCGYDVLLPGPLLEVGKSKRENSPGFRSSGWKHSAVKSSINALEVHGLEGFKRFVALAVLARNIQNLGSELIGQKRLQEIREKERERKRA